MGIDGVIGRVLSVRLKDRPTRCFISYVAHTGGLQYMNITFVGSSQQVRLS